MGLPFNLKYIIVVVGVVVAFFYYPPPPPSTHLIEWRETGTNFTFKNYNIFYKDVKGTTGTKEKRTLLLLHGFPTSSFDWYKVLPDLQKRFDRVVAPDFIGLGYSDKPTNFGYPIAFQADIIEALVARLQITGGVDILAHDYGDTVAQELLARFNDNKLKFDIKTTTLLNGGIFPKKHIPIAGQRLLRTPFLKLIFSKISNYYFFRASLNQVFGSNKPTDEEMNDWWSQQRYLNGYQVKSELLTYIDQRFQNEDRWVGALIEYSTTKPIHLIAGPADPINPRLCYNFKKTVPLGSCDVLPENVSHYPQLEDPKGLLKFYFAFLDSETLTPSNSSN